MGESFSFADAAAREKLRAALPAGARAIWKGIDGVLRETADEGLIDDPGEIIHRFVKAFYGQYAADTFENHERRLEDIQELVLFTAKFESLEGFLSDVSLLTNLDAETAAVDADAANAVRLSTVHQAKGLEWKAVFVLWATDGMFPATRALNESTDAESEERRLFYVAVTRAKDELCLCAPEVRRMPDGGVMYCQPSRFIGEIPRALVRQERVSLSGGGSGWDRY